MRKIIKLNVLFLLISLFIGCVHEKENKVTVKNKIAKKNKKDLKDKEAIEKVIKKDIKKKFTSTSLSLKQVVIKSKRIAIVDLNKDGLLDAVVFISFLNEKDNSFKETGMLYYKNEGKEMVLKDTHSSYKYIYPDERISNENVTWNKHIVFTEEMETNSLGIIDESKITEGNVSIEKEKISYGIFVSESNYDLNEHEAYKYVLAENGLIYRDAPNGNAKGKFSYGKQLHIVGTTGIKKIIYEEGKKLKGEWVEVLIDKNLKNTAFVFDGFLGKEHEVNYRILIAKSPVNFQSTYEKGAVLPGTHPVFNEKLQKISSIEIEEMTEVVILKKTKNKRPLKENETYCNWANFVTISFKGEELIVFGSNMLNFSANLKIRLINGEEVYLIQAENYTVKAGDEVELTGCDDYSEVYIKSKNHFSHIHHLPNKEEKDLGKKIFVHDEGMSERFLKINVVNDTINIKMDQSFQEGIGSYTLKVFKQDGWKYIETDIKRTYQ